MRPFAVAAAALALAAPLCAAAQPVSAPSGPDTYLSFHAGAYVPQHDDLRNFDTGIAFGGTFGALFTPNLGVEGEVGYWRVAGRGGLDERIWAIPTLASLRLRLPLKVAELSALAGGGIYFSTARLQQVVTAAGGFGVIVETSTERATAFGFHVGAGASFNLSPTMLVGAEVRRTFVPANFAGRTVRLDGLRAAVTLSYNL
jgi:opacity protein-like surface antigen